MSENLGFYYKVIDDRIWLYIIVVCELKRQFLCLILAFTAVVICKKYDFLIELLFKKMKTCIIFLLCVPNGILEKKED